MKFLTLTIILFSSLSFSQTQANDTTKTNSSGETIEAKTNDGRKVILRSDGTWTFAPVENQSEPSKSAVETIASTITGITPEKVNLFPQEYADKTLKFSNLRIGELQPYSEGNVTAYFVDTRSSDGKFFSNIPGPGDIKFVMSEDFARSLQNEYEKNGRSSATTMVVNAIVQLKVTTDDFGRRWVLAAVKCIEFKNYSGKTVRWIGTCT